MEDIFVRYMDMPIRVRGVTVLDEDGDYNVYINLRYSCETQQSILDHELRHINKDHFYIDAEIRTKEREANDD